MSKILYQLRWNESLWYTLLRPGNFHNGLCLFEWMLYGYSAFFVFISFCTLLNKVCFTENCSFNFNVDWTCFKMDCISFYTCVMQLQFPVEND